MCSIVASLNQEFLVDDIVALVNISVAQVVQEFIEFSLIGTFGYNKSTQYLTHVISVVSVVE